MQIKYTGTPGESHGSIYMYGLVMPLGKYVEVADHLAVRKLSNHPHFHVKVEEITDVESKQQEQELQALTAAAVETIEQHTAAGAQAATIAALTEEEKYGNAHGSGAQSAAEAQGTGSGRGAKRGRPRKGA